MFILGLIVLIVGGAGLALTLTGIDQSIGVLAGLGWSPVVWGIIAVVGAVMVVFFRRPAD
jgi:hypothetical protein